MSYFALIKKNSNEIEMKYNDEINLLDIFCIFEMKNNTKQRS